MPEFEPFPDNPVHDLYGTVLSDRYAGVERPLYVASDIAETEEYPVDYFFRNHDDMPDLERLALTRASGSILDVGAGAGNHTLVLQKSGKSVTALELSPGCCDIMAKRGVNRIIQSDFFKLRNQSYDTLLMLMNGFGIMGTLDRVPHFLEFAKTLLKPTGSILFDSSDLSYMYEEDDGSEWVNLNHMYKGEIRYQFHSNGLVGEPFPWLYIDFETISKFASNHGYTITKLYEDDHYAYLAELKLKTT